MASKFTGRQQEVAIARETTRGTPVVASMINLPKVNFTLEDKVVKARSMGNYGVLPGGDAAPVTQKWAEGTLEIEAQDKSIALLLYSLFGTLSSASFNSAYKHSLTIQNSVNPTTLTIAVKDPTDTTNFLVYARASVVSMELRYEAGEIVKAIVNFVSMPHKDWTGITWPTYTSENKFRHQDLRFKIAAALANLDAASKINIRSLVVRIDRMIARENALGTVQPVDMVSRGFKISATAVITYQDRTYRDYMLNGTTKAVRISLDKTDTTIGSTTPQLQLDLPIVHFDAWEPNQPIDDISTEEITMEALYDVTNSILVGSNTFVVNATASY